MEFADIGKMALSFGVNFGLSFVSGFVQKKVSSVAPKFTTKAIPWRNATIGGTATGVATGDPEMTVAGAAGALSASLAHAGIRAGIKKIFKRG